MVQVTGGKLLDPSEGRRHAEHASFDGQGCKEHDTELRECGRD